MKKSLVTLLITIGSIIFIILVSIVAILIAQGRRITDDGQIIETSIIRIVSNVSDYSAYINNQEVSVQDNKINNIVAGSLTIDIKKEGYGAWKKTLTIDSGIVEDVYVYLYPQTIPFQKVDVANITNIYNSQAKNTLFYIENSLTNATTDGIWKYKISKAIFDFSEIKPFQIARFDKAILELLKLNPYGITISSSENKILFSVPSQNIYYIYDSNQLNTFIDVYKVLGFAPENPKWMGDSLIYAKDGFLFEFDTSSSQTNLITFFADKINLSATSSTELFYIKDKILYEYSNKKSEAVRLPANFTNSLLTLNIQTLDTNLAGDIFYVKHEAGIVVIDFSRLFIDSLEGKLSIINISNNGKGLLINNDSNLYSYYLEDSLDLKSYTRNLYSLNLTTSQIKSVEFLPNNRTIVLYSDAIYVMDFDGHNNIRLIDSFDLDVPLAINATGIELYALAKEPNELNTVSNILYKFTLNK